jgi:hypothetical protein
MLRKIGGEEALGALNALHEKIASAKDENAAGMAVIEMFLRLFGEDATEKLLRFCEQNSKRASRKAARIIKRKICPAARRYRRREDRRGVRKYL